MRLLRPQKVRVGLRVGEARVRLASFGLVGIAGIALALGGCATHLASDACATTATIKADRADAVAISPANAVANRPARIDPDGSSNARDSSGEARPISALLLGLLGAPRMSSAEEEALIAHAIAEHEMRKP
jgi:hypothetical protein